MYPSRVRLVIALSLDFQNYGGPGLPLLNYITLTYLGFEEFCAWILDPLGDVYLVFNLHFLFMSCLVCLVLSCSVLLFGSVILLILFPFVLVFVVFVSLLFPHFAFHFFYEMCKNKKKVSYKLWEMLLEKKKRLNTK